MATRKFSNSGGFACDLVAAVKIAHKGDRASFRGAADELIEAGIILPKWIPQAPKRESTSYLAENLRQKTSTKDDDDIA